jgi:hypothetical protein
MFHFSVIECSFSRFSVLFIGEFARLVNEMQLTANSLDASKLMSVLRNKYCFFSSRVQIAYIQGSKSTRSGYTA